MWFIAIVLAALLLAILRLTSRYHYGRKSQRLLLVDLAGSLILGLALARFYFLSGAAEPYLALGGLGIGLLIFVFAALVTAELLRKAQQRVFDERLGALRGREQALLRELDNLNREMRSELRRREETEHTGQVRERQFEGHRERIERWKHEGGAVRIRSIKVEEWDREFRSLDAAGRADRRAALEKELALAQDSERRTHLEVMLAVAALAEEGQGAAATPSEAGLSDQTIATVGPKRRKVEADLAVTRSDLGDWQRRLTDFLAREIRLD